ncbi:MAG: hypothetical protein LCH96_02395 [Actinobacteria bacterium]|nr:hypothetical protein [Actinomycetota bacterium]
MTRTGTEPLTALLGLPSGSIDPYVVGGIGLSESVDRECAAQLLADDAMVIRCGASPLLDRWRRRRDGQLPQADDTRSHAVRVYASIGFGSPEEPAGDDHLEGLVAELFWNRLLNERRNCSDGRQLVHAHSVKPDPLEPGGDGLVIYKTPAGTLVFRLWEIKKHESIAPISATIRRASKQLAERGNEYLAKLAGPETIAQEGELGKLYAELVELWLDKHERAGVGVSVGTSADRAPNGPAAFGSILSAFPEFSGAGQIEGLIVAIPDFPGFSKRVREIVWSGL